MELRHLRYFVALANYLHFTKAAQSCRVTQSTLSHQIKQLEEELGQPLFERSNKRPVLTQAGQLLLPSVIEALAQVDEGIRALKNMKEKSGELRIGVWARAFSIALLPLCLERFESSHPLVQVKAVEIPPAQLLRALDDSSIELAICDELVESTGYNFQPLYREEMALAVRADHPFARRKRLRMVELHRQKIALPNRSFMTRVVVEECLRAAGAEPIVVAEMNTIEALTHLASRSELGVIVTRNSVEERPGIVGVPLDDPTPMRCIGLLMNSDRPMSWSGSLFVQAVQKTLAEFTAARASWPWVNAVELTGPTTPALAELHAS